MCLACPNPRPHKTSCQCTNMASALWGLWLCLVWQTTKPSVHLWQNDAKRLSSFGNRNSVDTVNKHGYHVSLQPVLYSTAKLFWFGNKTCYSRSCDFPRFKQHSQMTSLQAGRSSQTHVIRCLAQKMTAVGSDECCAGSQKSRG